MRASAGTAFRAPTINQIEPGIATTSRQFIGRIGTFKPIRALGNPELQPEAVSTFNAGAIYDFDGWRSAGIAATRTLSWEIDGWQFGPAYDAIGRLNYDTPLARSVLDWKGHLWVNAAIGGLNVRWCGHGRTTGSPLMRRSSISPTACRPGYIASSTTTP